MWGWLFLLILIYIIYSFHIIKNQLDAIHKKLEINEGKLPQMTNEDIEKELEKFIKKEHKN